MLLLSCEANNLRSIVVDYLETSPSFKAAGVAYVYCDYKQKLKQTAENLTWSLAYQLAEQCASFPQEVRTIYENCTKKGRSPALGDLESVLLSVSQTFPNTFIIVDALDECSELDDADGGEGLKFLSILQRLGSSVRLFITSRPHEHIQKKFKGASQVDILPTRSDIETFVEFRINENPEFARRVNKGRNNLKGDITGKILSNYNGVYVFAYLLQRLSLSC